MNIDPEYVDLINAEIDGELSVEEQQRLDAYLAGNSEATDLRAKLARLCVDLNTVEQIEPPAHLQHLIMDGIQPRKSTGPVARRTIVDLLGKLFATGAVRYAAAFSIGVILSYTVLNSERMSRHYFDDVTNLVGTMTQPTPLSDLETADALRLTLNEVAGTVTLNRSGPILVIDFDLASQEPVEIVAGFADPDIWFNGFAQLESSGTRVSAENGQVRLRMEGQGRYAVYLYSASPNAASVTLQFYSSGNMIHEDALSFGEEN